MNQRSGFGLILAFLAASGLLIYSYGSLGVLPGINEEDNVSRAGAGLNQEADDGEVIGGGREIKGRNNSTGDVESDDEEQGEAYPDGIVISSDLVAGEKARLVLYDDGDRLTDRQVYLDGEEIGRTLQTGALTFEVPHEEEIELSAGSDLEPKNFEIEGYEKTTMAEVNVVSPEEGVRIEGYRLSADWAVDAGEPFNVSVDLDGETIYRDTGEGIANFQESVVVEESGGHNLAVRVEQEGKTTQTETVEFVTTKDAPEPGLEISNPEEGEAFEDHRMEFDFDVSSVYPYNATLTVDGYEVERFEQEAGSSIPYPVFWGVKKGESKAVFEYSSEYFNDLEKQVVFSTGGQRPISDNILRAPFPNPQSGTASVRSSETQFLFDIDAYEDLEYELIIKNNGSNTTRDSGDLQKGQHTIEKQIELLPGEYEWLVKTKDGSGESRVSETWSLVVE